MESTISSDVSTLVARNSTVFITAQVIIRITAVGFAIYISRQLGSAGYGLYSLVTSFVALFSFPADLGLTTYTAREIARNHDCVNNLTSNTAILRLVIAPIIMFIAFLCALVMDFQAQVITGVILASLGFLVMAIQDTLEAVFIGCERLWFTAVTDLTNRMVFMIVALVALQWWTNFLMVIISLLMGSIAALVLSVILTKNRIGKIPIHFRPAEWPNMLKASLPIAVLFISFSISLRFDTFVLQRYFDNTTVGWYSAAYDVIFGLFIVQQGITTAVFATSSRLAVQEPERVTQLCQAAVKALVIFSLPCAIGGYLVAGELAVFLFGEEFVQTGFILRILLLTLPVRFLVGLMDNISIALSRSWSAAVITLVSSMLNIALNIWLTPRLGMMSAALIALSCETASMLFLFSLLSDLQLPRNVESKKWGLLISNLFMAIIIFIIPDVHLLLRISIGVIVYVACLISFGVLSFNEIKQLIQPFIGLFHVQTKKNAT